MEPIIGEKRTINSHIKLAFPDLNLDLDRSINAQNHKTTVSKIAVVSNMSVISM